MKQFTDECYEVYSMNIVAHNLSAMNAQRQFGINTRSKAKSTEKLSSGYKINRAADDAAGLAISEKMRRQIRGLTQGVENTQDGVSLCQVADGALAEVNDMLHRITELSVKSANGTNSEQDRQYIQEEINQILQEIERIGDTTTFNEKHIFSGGEAKSTYLPPTVGNIGVSGTPTDATAMTYNITADENGFSINGDDFAWSSFSNGANTLADTPISSGTYTFDYHGFTLSLDVEDDANIEDLVGRMNGASFATREPAITMVDKVEDTGQYDGYIQVYGGLPADADVRIKADTYGLSIEIDGQPYSAFYTSDDRAKVYPWRDQANIRHWNASHDVVGKADDNMIWLNEFRAPIANDIDLNSLRMNVNFNADTTLQELIDTFNNAKVHFEYAMTSSSGKPWYRITGIDLNSIQVSEGDNPILNKVKQTNYKGIEVPPTQEEIDNAPLSLWIQSGCEAGHGMWLEIDPMNTNILDIDDLDVSTVDGANHAIDAVKGALQKVTANRSKIGAQQNRLTHTIANEENVIENTTAAESRIRDTDMAKEMVRYSNINILEQVGHAMMAQANQSNQGVLSLLS